jgi:hypothetical protein
MIYCFFTKKQKVRQLELPHRKTQTPIVVTQILYFMGISTPFQDREFALLPYAKSILKCRDEKGYSFPLRKNTHESILNLCDKSSIPHISLFVNPMREKF